MFLDFFSSFSLGLLTPLTAVCVLPLYPGFLTYLANKLEGRKHSQKMPMILGLIVTGGVVIFMLLLGLLFTTLLQVSLTNVIQIISPIAFGILFVISILLIFNVDVGRFLPQYHAPIKKNPYWSAFIFGFFFGAIVIPCNPGFIGAFFARAILFENPITSVIHFLMFGFGLAFPLLVFSMLSSTKSQNIINGLVKHKRGINLGAGLIMLPISIYYLVFVFNILG